MGKEVLNEGIDPGYEPGSEGGCGGCSPKPSMKPKTNWLLYAAYGAITIGVIIAMVLIFG